MLSKIDRKFETYNRYSEVELAKKGFYVKLTGNFKFPIDFLYLLLKLKTENTTAARRSFIFKFKSSTTKCLPTPVIETYF